MQEEACCGAIEVVEGAGNDGVGRRDPLHSPTTTRQPEAPCRTLSTTAQMTVVADDVSLDGRTPPEVEGAIHDDRGANSVVEGEVSRPSTSRRTTPSDDRGEMSSAASTSLTSETTQDSQIGDDKGGVASPFGYSQKNFHIADGNLYSILTPFQAKAAASRQSPATTASAEGHRNKGDKGSSSGAPRARGRRRAKWKLKFHHQALPPEYLDHYEAAMAQEAKAAAAAAAAEASNAGPAVPSVVHPPPPSLIRIDKQPTLATEAAGPSKGSSGGGRASNKGGRRVPNFIQDLQMRDSTQDHQKTPITNINQFRLEPQDSGPKPEDAPSGPRLIVKTFPMSETTVSSSVQSPEVTVPSEEKRSSVIMASGMTAGRTEGSSTSTLRDLPYMGEMTLDSKPRRGRKPKKADICHLIYKNYGTIFNPTNSLESPVSTPRSSLPSPSPSSPSSSASSLSPSSSSGAGKSELIYKNFSATESLLAKRLTQSQEVKRSSSQPQDLGTEQDEPLNLCIRDLKRINVSGPFFPIKTEPVEAGDEKSPKEGDEEADPGTPGGDTASVANASFPALTTPVSTNYIYWPNAGVFVHPMALQSHLLYCQKMGAAAAVAAANAGTPIPIVSAAPVAVVPEKTKQHRTSEKPTVSNHVAPVVSLSIPGKHTQECPDTSHGVTFGRTVALRPADVARIPIVPTSDDIPSTSASGRKRVVHATSLATKRKRSAIFIPPTAENPTEVSICKFKFTGGAKPSLEEKKMLSVDAGGNFRYYSGTGDKSMRGYEFFPREQTLQQQYMGSTLGSLISNKPPTPSSTCSSTTSAAASSSSQPVSTATFPGDPSCLLPSLSPNVSITRSEHSPSTSRTNSGSLPFHRQSGDVHPVAGSSSEVALCDEGGGNQEVGDRKGSTTGPRRKRRTRKSLVREKLEQTFREKGFLIQTQQLESAEGATYCKFRQLRKFTRYLFRSWKDYLPGNIKEISSSPSPSISGGVRQEGCEASGVQPAVEVSNDQTSCSSNQ